MKTIAEWKVTSEVARVLFRYGLSLPGTGPSIRPGIGKGSFDGRLSFAGHAVAAPQQQAGIVGSCLALAVHFPLPVGKVPWRQHCIQWRLRLSSVQVTAAACFSMAAAAESTC